MRTKDATRWLNRNRGWIAETPSSLPALETPESPEISIGPPSASSSGPLLEDLGQVARTTKNSDVAGYDISSFEPNGRSRLIEVKTTNGWDRTPFFISRNEVAVSQERPSEWCLFRLWIFSRAPNPFEIRRPRGADGALTATAFRADFRSELDPNARKGV
ncbi:MAG: DUF3883 domain-containing protein [Boseongicola sp. SB0664_bin_43]|uniref:DUF3883 domain-containing protein n=1 Tax=Boseongicola sp. SB0664_bin_43 TaxID=2604844 RepID=A0A6B0Y5D0_9RHOB|nr:DUF3883 domain-containing protein [Boseongicola sp. SB0664_bin_43]